MRTKRPLVFAALVGTIFGCASAGTTVGGRRDYGPAHAAEPATQLSLPSTAADVRSVVVPCAVTGEGVRCWGRLGGKDHLAPPSGDAASLAESTDLFRAGPMLCGRNGSTWRCMAVPGASPMNEAQSWSKGLESLGPSLVDASAHRDAIVALLANGTVVVHDRLGETREVTSPGRAIRALGEQRGWAVLGTNGQVFVSPKAEGFDTTKWRNVVQIEGARSLLCARTGAGRAMAVTSARSLQGVVAALSGVNDAADIACSDRAACILHATGRVSCVGELELGEAFSKAPLALRDLEVQGARDIWMSQGDFGLSDLCLARGTEVLCSSVGGDAELRDTAVPVEGVPNLVDVATDQSFACGRTPQNTVWCWGNRGAPFEVQGASSRGLTVARGILYSLNTTGGLERRALAVPADHVRETTATPPIALPVPEAWPNPPENVELSSCGLSRHFVCARAKERARCWSFKPDGTDPETFVIPFPVAAIVPGPPVAAQRAEGGIALLAPKSRTWLDGSTVRGAERLGPPRLVEGEQHGEFFLSFGGSQTTSCNTAESGPVCSPLRDGAGWDWVRGSVGLRGGKLYSLEGGKPLLEGVRDADADNAAIVLFEIPGKPHVVSFNAIPLGLAGNYGRAGRLTPLRQTAR